MRAWIDIRDVLRVLHRYCDTSSLKIERIVKHASKEHPDRYRVEKS